jgi:hypothetical protein
MVAMDAQDLDQRRDREADAAHGDHRHDPVADPPAPGIGVVNISDAADTEREPQQGEGGAHCHDCQQ